MIVGVADTHAAVWYLFGDPRLSPGAKSFIDQAAASRRTIEISPISLAEVVYLLEKKNRLPASAFDSLRGALVNPKHVFKEAPLTGGVVEGDAIDTEGGTGHAGPDRRGDRCLFRGSGHQPRRENSRVERTDHLVGCAFRRFMDGTFKSKIVAPC